jgi:hypothetical protein
MCTEHWCNDTDRGKSKYWDKNLSQHHATLSTENPTWIGIKPRPPQTADYCLKSVAAHSYLPSPRVTLLNERIYKRKNNVINKKVRFLHVIKRNISNESHLFKTTIPTAFL